MQTPLWALELLVAELPGVEAARTQQLAQAAALPHLKDSARREVVRSLAALSGPRGPAPPDLGLLLATDPDAAAALLEAAGITVKRAHAA